ncbi:membrane protein [Paractinoplanes abujensis]|uniref:Putative repeat protein (TIGR03943 family) n=1 Tax=Paractinoplanes abujensis TaxID=882441 RepID=A0A7W7CL46_9ACTN|nr:TIGR03943 family protein [Actinoplanes abujensis]MBB4690555.1 putative repeat protein (TIGR03943 family) [Actinoplanes abujensis]GID24926.1 membrane protein [Actinoplanes abujensis]
MNRLTQGVILLLFGGAILRASFTDLYLRYVKEGLRPFLIATGLLLVAAAVMTIWYSWRSAEQTGHDEHAEHDDDGHGHGEHGPRVGWLLILPVLGLLLVAPPALGSYAANQAGSVVAAPVGDSDYPPLPEGPTVELSMIDYASRALFDDGKSLTGRDLKLTGFITTAPDGAPMLARIVLSCCAADGRPIKLGLTGRAPIDVPADTWVEVTGVYTGQRGKDPVNNVDVAFLEVKSWQEVPQPKQPYA